ncbi:MAG: phosphoglycerate dehydrogenase [Bacteroidota bacterium]
MKVLLLENIHPSAIHLFKKNGFQKIEVVKGAISEKELIKKIKNVSLLGLRSKTQLTKNVLENASNLIAAGAFCIGTNQIDLKTATERGVAIFNSPFSNTRSVAELVIGLCISLLRRIPEKNNAAHKGIWLKESDGCFELRGKTLGIIGYGHIGSQVSVLAESMGMKVVFYDVINKLALGNAASCKSLDELLKKSDVISLHVPGNAETKSLINSSRIKKMKKGVHIINLSRGDVLDLVAVKQAIISNHIAGLAVDVFPEEPKTNKDKFISPLQHLPNTILTPHIGGSTVEAQEAIGIDVAEKLINYSKSGSSLGSLTIPEINLPIINHTHRILHIHQNVPGVLSEVNGVLSRIKVNILGQYLQTNNNIGYVALEIDKKVDQKLMRELQNVKNTIRTRNI